MGAGSLTGLSSLADNNQEGNDTAAAAAEGGTSVESGAKTAENAQPEHARSLVCEEWV